jgi:hypothetical protein
VVLWWTKSITLNSVLVLCQTQYATWFMNLIQFNIEQSFLDVLFFWVHHSISVVPEWILFKLLALHLLFCRIHHSFSGLLMKMMNWGFTSDDLESDRGSVSESSMSASLQWCQHNVYWNEKVRLSLCLTN